jgi:leucyl-tRNA---protein transferase
MTQPIENELQKIQFYVTAPYPCSYLSNQLAQSLIATPQHLVDAYQYSGLIQQGFRRSGSFVYRPHCENCNACIPVRLPVNAFKPSRSQKRAFKTHNKLEVGIHDISFEEEHFSLYKRYQASRHEADLEQETSEQYQNFLAKSNVDTLFVTFREQGILKMVSVIDIVEDGISAVYTFYDTTDKQASYGTYSVMWLIAWCQRLGLPYLYLGYWIKNSRKMAYKQKFEPQEALIDGEWKIIKHSQT